MLLKIKIGIISVLFVDYLSQKVIVVYFSVYTMYTLFTKRGYLYG